MRCTLSHRWAFAVVLAMLIGFIHGSENLQRPPSLKTIAQVKKVLEQLRINDKNMVPDKNVSLWNVDFLKHISDMNELSEKTIQDELARISGAKSDTRAEAPNNQTSAEAKGTKEKSRDMRSLARKVKEMIKVVAEASQKRSSPSSIRIGRADVPREKVTAVGDVDGNGFEDYIVANPASMNDTGTIRLYLMKADNKFLYTRDLVPGKYGFVGAPLMRGDRFGHSVEKIANDSPNFTFVTITAPGDRSVPGDKGALYIVQLSDKGNVINNAKLSSKTIETVLTKSVRGDDANDSHSLNQSILSKKMVDILSNNTSMLLVRKHGEIKGAYVISSAEDHNMLHQIEQKMTPTTRLASLRLQSPPVRAQLSSSCFFNDTHCACVSNAPPVGSAQCTQVIGSEASTGRTVCQTRDCMASYSCACEGTELCERSERTLSTFVVDGAASGGNVYCSRVQKTITENVLIPGAQVPLIVSVNELPPYNATHCRCAKKQSVTGDAKCLDVLRALGGVNYVCSQRDCRIGPGEYICDAFGDSYCSRSFVEKIHFVKDGEKGDEAGAVFCHQEAYQAESVVRIL
eukprot:TRINITY_DN63115_c0_g1_i1.p1 TRINITY_DN63115_c0_g1~~TRINITY_DN63115_c0_g1_i1.p1  ORF type:complete len:573 (-),score=99.66 TRINITY_DN63115_c0_g1_i1:133-1851(-)